ncbi:MAG: hypothetical protein IOC54_18525 [Methylobacterium sp.]|nr:hypothetical protein [Roseomonas sp.]MCA3296564.1 hypothetical protein [Roseomonas sp.]MCA3653799.1 hypothetical protein [Methylobacterium sp.]
MGKFFFAAVFLLLSGIAHGQGAPAQPPLPNRTPCFNPGTLRTSAERALCNQPMGQAAQEAFLRSYARLLDTYPVKSTLRENQANWMNTIFLSSHWRSFSFRELYAARVREIEWISQRTSAATSRLYSKEELRSTCADLPPPSLEPFLLACKVHDIKELDDGRFISQLQLWSEESSNSSRDLSVASTTLIFERSGDSESHRWRLILWAVADPGSAADMASFGRHDEKELIHVPVVVMNSGMTSQDFLFARSGNQWREINTTSWLNSLGARVPRGWRVSSNFGLDVTTLEARGVLFRPDDGGCCPTGGVAISQLSIGNEALVFRAHKVEPLSPPARPTPSSRSTTPSPSQAR